MPGRLSAEDMLAIQEVIALYNWHFDAGKGDDWASLWTEDGEFIAGDNVTRGRRDLATLVTNAFKTYGDGIRHNTTDIIAEYGDGPGIVHAKAHLLVTLWTDKPSFFGATHAELTLVRQHGEWKLRSNRITIRRAAAGT